MAAGDRADREQEGRRAARGAEEGPARELRPPVRPAEHVGEPEGAGDKKADNKSKKAAAAG